MCLLHNGDEPKTTDAAISPRPLPSPLPAQQKRRKRLKLWEIPESRHCMIIGTCLTVAEARGQLERVGLDARHLNDYQIHTYAVQSAGDKKNKLALRLQRQLDKKYAADVRRFAAAKTVEELAELWTASIGQGLVAGPVWAVSTHPCIDEGLSYEVFGEVHMMSHLQGASGRRENAQLKKANARVEELEAELLAVRATEQRRRDRELTRIAELTRELSDLRVKKAQVHQRSASQAAAERSSKELVRQRQLAVVQGERAERQAQEIEQLRLEVQRLAEQLEQQRGVNAQLEQTIENLLPCGASNEECEADLRGRCILYLGGHNHLCQRFRSIVEAKQGEFLHHDGGKEQQLTHLQGMLHRADVVFCPTERISHNAMNKARKLCRDNPEKPIVFLDRPSISAFVNGLNKLPRTGEGEALATE